jgi:malate dehydrogenase (oxaloacetate-decarboxylating)
VGVGLGVLAVGVRRAIEAMFLAAARALAEGTPACTKPNAARLPAREDIRQVSRRMVRAVAAKAQEEKVAQGRTMEELERARKANWGEPRYPRLRYTGTETR